jgi:hypothetical protein
MDVVASVGLFSLTSGRWHIRKLVEQQTTIANAESKSNEARVVDTRSSEIRNIDPLRLAPPTVFGTSYPVTHEGASTKE